MTAEAPPVYQQEAQLLEALRRLAPPDAWLLVAVCQPGPAGAPICEGAYLTRSAAGAWAAGRLPALPAALKQRFGALLAALRAEDAGAAWDACRVTLPFDLLAAAAYQFPRGVVYSCRTAREGSVNPADYAAAYELPTPTELLTSVQHRDEELDRARRLNPARMEQALLAVLLPALPADCHQALVRYEAETAHAPAGLRDIYLITNEEKDGARAQPLPPLPAAVATGFADFRRAALFQSGAEWVSVEAWVRLVADGYGGEELAVNYCFDPPRPLRCLLDEAAPAGESPVGFAARVRAALAASLTVDEDNAAAGSEIPTRPAVPRQAPAAASSTWGCTWCQQEYTGPKQPTSFQPGKCPRNPGRAHAWHRQ